MVKRITVTLPDKTAKELEDWASDEGRPTANLASYLIQKAVDERNKQQSSQQQEK